MMFPTSGAKKPVTMWIFMAFLAVLNVHSQVVQSPTMPCPSSKLLCGGSTCYDPTTQLCTEFGTIVECVAVCGSQCYNSSSHQCFDGNVCRLGEQLCYVKYDSSYGYEERPHYYRCYDPSNRACLNNSLCYSPSRSCNDRCILDNQMCVNNMTVCNVTGRYYDYERNQIQLCNGVCYDTKIQKCIGGSIQCIDDCSGVCYNSSSHQCFDGNICRLGEQLCYVKYDSSYGYEERPHYYRCYDPSNRACLNNSLCYSPSRSCNGRCILDNQMCVNNMTVCNVTGRYYEYEMNQIQLCNGVCYDTKIQKCVSEHGITNMNSTSTTTAATSTGTTTVAETTTTTDTTTVAQTTTIADTTTSTPGVTSCCSPKQCTTDADCCITGTECQCFRHANEEYGSCLNPYVQPICASGCSAQQQCRNDTDCCKFQCGEVTVTNAYGNRVTKSQCVPR